MSSRMARRSAAFSGEMATCLLIGCSSQASRMARVSRNASIPVLAILAADAGIFESSPRRLRIVRHAVDHDPAGPQVRGHAACADEVGAENGCMQAKPGVVCDRNRIVF